MQLWTSVSNFDCETTEKKDGSHLLCDDERDSPSMFDDLPLQSKLLLERKGRVYVQRHLATGEHGHFCSSGVTSGQT